MEVTTTTKNVIMKMIEQFDWNQTFSIKTNLVKIFAWKKCMEPQNMTGAGLKDGWAKGEDHVTTEMLKFGGKSCAENC